MYLHVIIETHVHVHVSHHPCTCTCSALHAPQLLLDNFLFAHGCMSHTPYLIVTHTHPISGNSLSMRTLVAS